MGNQQSNDQAGNDRRNYEDAQMLVQMSRQAGIITSDETCKLEIAQALGVNANDNLNEEMILDRFDEFALKYKLDREFYNASLLRVLSCFMRVGLTSDKNLTASQYVHNFFSNVKQIGAPSVEGVAMMTGVKGESDLFVVKAPKDPKKDFLTHEYFIASGGSFVDVSGMPRNIIGTNWLRNVCLNYAQIISAFRCGAPDIDPLSKKLRNWCSLENPMSYVNYVAYEKINGPDMNKIAKTMDAETFITSMIQLAYALELGQMYNGFTHYDLHYENVIMRPCSDMSNNPNGLPEYALIPFVLGQMTVYVKSRYIPTIIDFGRSHIQAPSPAEAYGSATDAEHFGYRASFAMKYGIAWDEARPYYDLFKILGFTMYTMYASQNPAFDQIWPIMGFFGLRNRQSVVDWLVEGRGSTLYSLITKAEEMNFCLTKQIDEQLVCLPEDSANMFDFLQYVEAQFPEIWQSNVFGTPQQGHKTLKCGVECLEFKETLNNLISNENVENPVGVANGNFDRSTGTGFRDFMRYRNNMKSRALYFSLHGDEADQYGKALLSSVNDLDAQLTNQDGQVLNNYFKENLESVFKTYLDIGYPLDVNANPNLDAAGTMNKLNLLNSYLDRMAVFAKSFAEMKETYQNLNKYSEIVGEKIPEELNDYININVMPLHETFNTSRMEIDQILRSMNVPDEYAEYRNSIIVRTF